MGKGKLRSGDQPLESTRRDAIEIFAGTLAATILGRTNVEAEEGFPYTFTLEESFQVVHARFDKYEDGRFHLIVKDVSGNPTPLVLDLTEFDTHSRSLLLQLAGLPQPLEEWVPQVIPMIDRLTGKQHDIEVADVKPLAPNIAPTHVFVGGKWYSLDGNSKQVQWNGRIETVVKGFDASQATLDAIQAARDLPSGRVEANGYDDEFNVLDDSAFEGVEGTALEFNNFGAFTIQKSDRRLIATGAPVVGPDEKPIMPVHQIERFGRDTLIIHASEGRKYKLVGKSRKAELIGRFDTVRRDQFGLMGIQLRSTVRPKDTSDSVPRNENWNPIHYLDLGHFHVDRDGKLQIDWQAPELQGVTFTFHTDAVALPDDCRVKCVGTNQFGDLSVVYERNGVQDVCVFGPNIRRHVDENKLLKGATITYEMIYTPTSFKEKAREQKGFDVSKITHVISNGESTTFFGATGVPRVLRTTSNDQHRHSQFLSPSTGNKAAYYSPYELMHNLGYGDGVTIEGNRLTASRDAVAIDLVAEHVGGDQAKVLQTEFARRQWPKDGERLVLTQSLTNNYDPFGSRHNESAYTGFAKMSGSITKPAPSFTTEEAQ